MIVDGVMQHIASTPIAMGLLDTRRMQIIAANPAFANLLGRSIEVTIGLRIDEYLDGDRLEAAKTVVDALRRGWVDSVEGYVEFRHGSGGSASAYSWSVPIGPEPPYDSVLMGAAPARGERPTGFDVHRVDPTLVILGTLDHEWRFSDVSVRATALLGWPPGREGTAPLQEIAHPNDVPALLALLGRAAVGKDVTAIHVRLRAADGEWRAAHITVSPLGAHASPRFGVAIFFLREEEGRELDRAAEVEEQLWRIAAEMRAGLVSVPVGMAYANLAGLSARQNEIVRRLVQGQRVKGIAADLFLSQSTVRNHLSASFRRLGVSSQAELIEKLRAQNHANGSPK